MKLKQQLKKAHFDWRYVLVFGAAVLVYANTLSAEFTYDDRQAVLQHPLVLDDAESLSEWISLDFWGTPMINRGSHKSWRPLTTLTFRVNYIIDGANPFWFHSTNILLHGCATVIFLHYCKSQLASNFAILFSSVLFAVHPIHCEAIASIVGRADCLMTIFVLLGLSAHYKYTLLWTVLAVLSKEQGAVLPLLKIVQLATRLELKRTQLHLLLLYFASISLLRLLLNGFEAPTFSSNDNPIAAAPTQMTKVLSYAYVAYFHFRLLCYPKELSFDWSVQAVPPMNSIYDARFPECLAFYIALGIVLFYCTQKYIKSLLNAKIEKAHQQFVQNLAIMLVPYILFCSNVFVSTGFYIAERILYLSSVGYCVIFGIISEKLLKMQKISNGNFLSTLFLVILSMHTNKTRERNKDWANECSLFSSAIPYSPLKAYANLGNYFASSGDFKKARFNLEKAIEIKPSFADAHYNLAIVLHKINNTNLAVMHYEQAIRHRPSFAHAYLNLGLLLMQKSNNPLPMFKACINIDATHSRRCSSQLSAVTSCAYNAALYHIKKEQYDDAAKMLFFAVSTAPKNYEHLHNIYNQLGFINFINGEQNMAEFYLDQALKNNPRNTFALINLAQLRIQQNRTFDAEMVYRKIFSFANVNPETFLFTAVFYAEQRLFHSVSNVFEQVKKLNTENFETIFYLATICRINGDNVLAKEILKHLISISSNTKYLAAYGSMEHLIGNYQIAKFIYESILQKDPHDQITIENLRKVNNLLT